MRSLEAQGRGLWNADEEKLEKLRELYESTEDELETVCKQKIKLQRSWELGNWGLNTPHLPIFTTHNCF